MTEYIFTSSIIYITKISLQCGSLLVLSFQLWNINDFNAYWTLTFHFHFGRLYHYYYHFLIYVILLYMFMYVWFPRKASRQKIYTRKTENETYFSFSFRAFFLFFFLIFCYYFCCLFINSCTQYECKDMFVYIFLFSCIGVAQPPHFMPSGSAPPYSHRSHIF